MNNLPESQRNATQEPQPAPTRPHQRTVPFWLPLLAVGACGVGVPTCYFLLAALRNLGFLA